MFTLTQHLRIQEGSTWLFRHTVEPVVDISGYTAKMTIKSDFSSNAEAIIHTDGEFQGTITLSDVGVIDVSMTAVQTSALVGDLWYSGVEHKNSAERFVEYIYDLQLTNGVAVDRVLQGTVIVERGVSE